MEIALAEPLLLKAPTLLSTTMYSINREEDLADTFRDYQMGTIYDLDTPNFWKTALLLLGICE